MHAKGLFEFGVASDFKRLLGGQVDQTEEFGAGLEAYHHLHIVFSEFEATLLIRAVEIELGDQFLHFWREWGPFTGVELVLPPGGLGFLDKFELGCREFLK